MLKFMAELPPDVAPQRRKFIGEVIMSVMAGQGKSVSEQARSVGEVEAWARGRSPSQKSAVCLC